MSGVVEDVGLSRDINHAVGYERGRWVVKVAPDRGLDLVLEKPPNGDTPRSWSGTREREVGIWVVGKVWSERAVDESAIVAYTDALKC
ncbi:hypothetical protein Tco_0269439 [Tanacetum coccineum]